MSRTPSAVAVAIGCGSMAWGFWGLAAGSAVSWTASWLDAAWILGGLAVTCTGAYALGDALREVPE